MINRIILENIKEQMVPLRIERLEELNQEQKEILLRVIINIQKRDIQELEKNLIKFQEKKNSV